MCVFNVLMKMSTSSSMIFLTIIVTLPLHCHCYCFPLSLSLQSPSTVSVNIFAYFFFQLLLLLPLILSSLLSIQVLSLWLGTHLLQNIDMVSSLNIHSLAMRQLMEIHILLHPLYFLILSTIMALLILCLMGSDLVPLLIVVLLLLMRLEQVHLHTMIPSHKKKVSRSTTNL